MTTPTHQHYIPAETNSAAAVDSSLLLAVPTFSKAGGQEIANSVLRRVLEAEESREDKAFLSRHT